MELTVLCIIIVTIDNFINASGQFSRHHPRSPLFYKENGHQIPQQFSFIHPHQSVGHSHRHQQRPTIDELQHDHLSSHQELIKQSHIQQLPPELSHELQNHFSNIQSQQVNSAQFHQAQLPQNIEVISNQFTTEQQHQQQFHQPHHDPTFPLNVHQTSALSAEPLHHHLESVIHIPEINSPCVIDNQCDSTGLRGVICVNGWCRCGANFVQVNNTHCLPGMLLGFNCESHAQCNLRVKHSGCHDGFCQCESQYVPYKRNKCLEGSLVGTACRSHEQCQVMNWKSFCDFVVAGVFGRCKCNPGTAQSKNDDKCGVDKIELGSPCRNDNDCDSGVPGAKCLQDSQSNKKQNEKRLILGKCLCPETHRPSADKSFCLSLQEKTASLGTPCQSSRECVAVDPYSRCEEGICNCIVKTDVCSPQSNGCYADTFQCFSDGRCISWSFVCNGVENCADGSDEHQCQPNKCPSVSYTCRDGTCISRGMLCDGRVHCADGSDEDVCLNGCHKSTFSCMDGSCIPEYGFCNAFPTCPDSSDEVHEVCYNNATESSYCPYRCLNGACRSTAVLCSGADGCGDYSDEILCQVCKCPKP